MSQRLSSPIKRILTSSMQRAHRNLSSFPPRDDDQSKPMDAIVEWGLCIAAFVAIGIAANMKHKHRRSTGYPGTK